MKVPKLEREIGIEAYATQGQGIGGRLRQVPEDFRVEEILTNGSKASIHPPASPHLGVRGRYLICILVKRNIDTFLAVRAVAKRLRISQERIQIAGIKDARALTAQHISIGRMLPEQLAEFEPDNVRLYPLAFSNEKVSASLIYGNEFKIVIRSIWLSLSETSKRIANVQNELHQMGGCPNFFGYQRFGTVRPISHLIGKLILRGQWQEAALTFLAKSSPYEHPESREARELLWQSQNYADALRRFPFKLVYERQMLQHLVRQPSDFMGAFFRLPEKLLGLFVQAYQSYLFNLFLSQRIQHELPLKNALRGEHQLRTSDDLWLSLPVIGFRQFQSPGEQGEIERQILESEGVKPQDFKVSGRRELSSPGGLRAALTPPIDFTTEIPRKGVTGFNGKAVVLAFKLVKGSYATVVLREFMKPRNPIEAGF